MPEDIVFAEGYSAYHQIISVEDNPYEGVHDKFARIWADGWWDAFYGNRWWDGFYGDQ